MGPFLGPDVEQPGIEADAVGQATYPNAAVKLLCRRAFRKMEDSLQDLDPGLDLITRHRLRSWWLDRLNSRNPTRGRRATPAAAAIRFEMREAAHVVDKVLHADLHGGTHQPDGAHDLAAHRARLMAEYVLDAGAHPRARGVAALLRADSGRLRAGRR